MNKSFLIGLITLFNSYLLPVIRPIILFLDGHYSHLSPSVLDKAIKNQIVFIGLPAHTTDLFQPLDLSVFRPFKAYWKKAHQLFTAKTPFVSLEKSKIVALIKDPWIQAFTPANILAGWKESGLWSLNKSVHNRRIESPLKLTINWQHYHHSQFLQGYLLPNCLPVYVQKKRSILDVLEVPHRGVSVRKRKESITANGCLLSQQSLLEELQKKRAKPEDFKTWRIECSQCRAERRVPFEKHPIGSLLSTWKCSDRDWGTGKMKCKV